MLRQQCMLPVYQPRLEEDHTHIYEPVFSVLTDRTTDHHFTVLFLITYDDVLFMFTL